MAKNAVFKFVVLKENIGALFQGVNIKAYNIHNMVISP